MNRIQTSLYDGSQLVTLSGTQVSHPFNIVSHKGNILLHIYTKRIIIIHVYDCDGIYFMK